MKRRKYYIILIIPFLLIPFASSRPDGLEWVAEKLGFADAACGSAFVVFSLVLTPIYGYLKKFPTGNRQQ
jgi:hypothetical protein